MLVSGIVRPKYEKVGLTVTKAPTKKAPAQRSFISRIRTISSFKKKKEWRKYTIENINNKQKELEQKLEDLKKQQKM